MPSGPVALSVRRFRSSLRTPATLTWIGGMSGYGLSPLHGIVLLSSMVNTDLNWVFSISALLLLSLFKKPSLFFSGETPVDSQPLLFTYTQNFLELVVKSLLTTFSM